MYGITKQYIKYRSNTEAAISQTVWQEESTVEKKWQKIKQVVNEAMIRKKIKNRKELAGHKNCCTRKKREVQRIYKRWRRGKVDRKRYVEERRKMRNARNKTKRKM